MKIYIFDLKYGIFWYSSEIRDQPSEIKLFNLVVIYGEKAAKTDRNCYVAEERIISKLLEISMPNFNGRN